MILGKWLEDRIQEALAILRIRNPEVDWDREQLIRLALGYGLNVLFREHRRVPVDFRGTVCRLYPAGPVVPVTVVDLSISGAGLLLQKEENFRKSEILLLDFEAGHGLRFEKTVLVRSVHEERIGCVFVDPDENRDVEAYLAATGDGR